VALPTGAGVSVHDLESNRGSDLLGLDEPAISFAFSPDGQALATGHPSGAVRVWREVTGRMDENGWIPVTEYLGHSGRVAGLLFTRDGRSLLSSASDLSSGGSFDKKSHTVRVWGTAVPEFPQLHWTSPDTRLKLNSRVSGLGFHSAHGQWVGLTTSYDLEVWAVAQRNRLHRLSDPAHFELLRSLARDRDSSWMMTTSDDRTARLWHLTAKEPLKCLLGPFSGDGRSMSDTVWDSDLNLAKDLLVVHLGYELRAYRASDCELVGTLPVEDFVTGFRILAAKNLVAFASGTHVQLWDPESDALATIYNSSATGEVRGFRFHHDESKLAIWVDKTVQVVASDGSNPVRLQGHQDLVWDAEFSPDGGRLVTASWDDTAKVWDLDGPKLLHTLKPEDGDVYKSVFTDDGKRIFTGSKRLVTVWEAASGASLVTLEVNKYIHAKAVHGIDMTGNGAVVGVMHGGGVTALWRGAVSATPGVDISTRQSPGE
jgi:WD40 repeat protein